MRNLNQREIRRVIETGAQISSLQNLDAEILIHLPNNLDRASNRQMAVAIQSCNNASLRIDRCFVPSQLDHFANDPNRLIGEAFQIISVYARSGHVFRHVELLLVVLVLDELWSVFVLNRELSTATRPRWLEQSRDYVLSVTHFSKFRNLIFNLQPRKSEAYVLFKSPPSPPLRSYSVHQSTAFFSVANSCHDIHISLCLQTCVTDF